MRAAHRLLPLLRPAPLVALGALALMPAAAPAGRAADRTSDLEAALRTRGLKANEIAWVGAAQGLGSYWMTPRAFVVASKDARGPDVYLLEARQSPEGRVIEIENVYDVTSTSVAAEGRLSVRGEHVAWVSGSENAVYRIELGDLGGQEVPRTEEWTNFARIQNAITNWQRTGQAQGLARRSFKLEPAGQSVRLELGASALHVDSDGHRIVIPYDAKAPIVGARYIVEQDRELAIPGNLVTWAVDRARETSWFGNERMQALKAVVFAGLDVVERAIGRIRPDDSAERIAEELGATGGVPSVEPRDVELGWPPAPMRPIFGESLPGEGHWRLLGDDPFIKRNPGAPPPVVTTFVRTDEDRVYSRIFVALWDPRQVDLHMVPGTEEPQTATGETGTGLVPRDPSVLTRLVAAFNGGFQSTHGDYGMMVERHVLVPPRPYAATLALLADGVIGFGTWPHDVAIDARLVSFRQNLTPLVQGGEVNPYGRRWWGGVPQGWEDETRTVRSGICMTREGFIAYFYGSKVDHEHLGKAMQSARCEYGMHLDMNQGHTGLEFYRVEPKGTLPALAEKPDGLWMAEGPLTDLPGHVFRGRRLVKHMQLMHFPRYIRRSERDFFYLTLRHLLPPARIEVPGAEPGEGSWRIENLPQHGWPHAVATTEVRPDPARPETKARLLAIDPKFITPGPQAAQDARVVVALDDAVTEPDAPRSAPLALWHDARRFTLATEPPSPSAVRLVNGTPDPPATGSRGALGLTSTGMAIYAEIATNADPDRDGALLSSLLTTVGCTATLFFTNTPSVALAGTHDLGGHPSHLGPRAVRLFRRDGGEVERIFTETPVLPLKEWSELQRQRRFFAKEDPTGAPAP